MVFHHFLLHFVGSSASTVCTAAGAAPRLGHEFPPILRKPRMYFNLPAYPLLHAAPPLPPSDAAAHPPAAAAAAVVGIAAAAVHVR